MWTSPIIRMNGAINKINDTVIGGGGSGISGNAKFAGQLGQSVWIDPSQIIYDSATGTLYGGRFRYVRFRAADAAAYTIGQIMFWDTQVSSFSTAYQVTNSESLSSTDNAIFIAGIYIGTTTYGNYGFIQDVGIVPVKFRAALTGAGALGSRVYAAGAGAGVDQGFADVIDSANPTLFSDVSLMAARYLGNAVVTPTNAGLKNVSLAFHNILG